MFKKAIALLLTVLTVLSLCACSITLFGGKEEETEPSTEPTTEWTFEWTTEELFTEEESSTEFVSVHDCATEGHLWVGPTCKAPKTCSVCGLTEGSAVGHSYLAATCTKAQRCRYCGLTKGSALGHTFNDAGKCTRCGASKNKPGSANCDHDYADADCYKPRTCKKCGYQNGSPNKHNYAPATCDKPQTCRNCGATTGSALGHQYAADGTCTRKGCPLNPNTGKTTTTTTTAPTTESTTSTTTVVSDTTTTTTTTAPTTTTTTTTAPTTTTTTGTTTPPFIF